MTAIANTSPLTSVFAGRRCVGFLFRRGAAVEAFDEFTSLGLFETQDAAIAAIAQHTKENRAVLEHEPGRKSVDECCTAAADTPQD
jgi:hypothetical protein